jgi:preprotein translocase subunit SecB
LSQQNFNIIEIYCSKSIFTINGDNEISWLKEKEKKMSTNISLNLVKYNLITENTYLVKLGASLIGMWDKKEIYSNVVEFSAIINVNGFNNDTLEMLMNVNINGFIFPYIRSELTRGVLESKMPAIHIQPIDFVSFYQKQKQKQKENAKSPT